MLKQFLGLILFMGILLSVVFMHYNTYNADTQKMSISAVVKLTKLTSPSFSVAYYEPRVLFYDGCVNPAYPQMQAINKMDFVYAK